MTLDAIGRETPPPPPANPGSASQGPAQPQEFNQTLSTAQADADAKALYDATAGWGTDEGAIWKTLEGKSAEQIALIRKSYKEHYGRDLDNDLRDDTSGKDLEHVEALLKGSGNKAEVDAVRLEAEREGVFGDDQEILKIIDNATPEQRHQIAAAYAKKYGGAEAQGKKPEDFLLSRLQDGLSPSDMDRARNLLGVSQAKTPEEAQRLEAEADAGRIKVAVDGAGTDEDTIRTVLSGKSPQEIAAIEKAYQDKYGESLAGRLKDEADGSAEQDVFLRYLNPAAEGDTQANAAASAERIKLAVDGIDVDEAAIEQELEGKSQAELDAIKAAYKEKYGHDLSDRLGEEADDVGERDTWQRLLTPPAKDDAQGQAEASAERIRMAVDGAGTDEDAIRKELEGKSKADIDMISAAYKEKYGEDLRERLDGELDGREQIELLQQDYDLGAINPNDPNGARERLRRLQEQQDGEEGLGLAITSGFQELTMGESDQDRLEKHMAEAQAALDSGDVQRANRLTGFAEGDLDSEQAAKDKASEVVAEGAAIVASTAVVIGTAGTATPLVVAGWAATAGAVAGASSYAAMQGGAADPADIAKHAALGGASGATAIVGGGAALTTVGRQAVVTAGKEVVTAGGRQVAGQSLGAAARQGAINGAKGGAAQGASYNAADTAIQRETWNDGFFPGLLRVGGSAVQGAAAGAVLGAATGAGINSGLYALGRGRVPPNHTPESEPAVPSSPPLQITARPASGVFHRLYTDADLAQLTRIRGEIGRAVADGQTPVRPDGSRLGAGKQATLSSNLDWPLDGAGQYRSTLAFADVSIPGVNLGRIKSFSSSTELAGFAPKVDPQNAFYTPLRVGGMNRINDAEAKLYQQIYEATASNPNVKGTVRVVIDRPSCDSCLDLPRQLIMKRPGLEIEVVYGPLL